MTETGGIAGAFADDWVINGSGTAGPVAARLARELGLQSVTFEVIARTGGRAYTEADSLGFSWDHAEHMHGVDAA